MIRAAVLLAAFAPFCCAALDRAVESPGMDGGAVVFRFLSPSARTVQVAGDWNNWSAGDAEQGEILAGLMEKGENGLWTIAVELPPGRHRYWFVVNETRRVLDPANPTPDLYVRSAAGGLERVELVEGKLSERIEVAPPKGSLVFYRTAAVDPEKPGDGVAGSARVPADMRRVIAVVVPNPADDGPPYRMVLIDENPAQFRNGESRIVSFLPVETAVEAGEHRLRVKPGAITRLPAVRKRNEFNMAQTNFYFREGENWTPFTERQMQYLDDFRRLFLVHVSPGAAHPSVTTILDVAPAPPPAG